MLTSQTPVLVSCQDLQRKGSGFSWTPSGSTINSAIRFNTAFFLKLKMLFVFVFLINVCILPYTILSIGLHHLLCEGRPCSSTCELPQQGLLFDWQQVSLSLTYSPKYPSFHAAKIFNFALNQKLVLLFRPGGVQLTEMTTHVEAVIPHFERCLSPLTCLSRPKICPMWCHSRVLTITA